MRLVSFRIGLFSCGAALALVCSCEKHQVGEYPEVQRDRLREAKNRAHENHSASSATATPVDFFPEQKSR